jgi:histidyl-tRNA synthetase
MEELQLFPETIEVGTKVLLLNLGTQESACAFNVLQLLRKKEVPSEIYPEQAKLDKQFKYAERKNIPFAIIIGTKELDSQTATVKDLRTGQQNTVTLENLSDFLFI